MRNSCTPKKKNEHHYCCENDEEEEFDRGENRIMFTQTQLEEDKQEALALAQIMLEEWRKTTMSQRSPNSQSQLKKCDLNCELQEHPYGSLRFCPRILAKSPNEINDIIKSCQERSVQDAFPMQPTSTTV